jgi:hypothetical protein
VLGEPEHALPIGDRDDPGLVEDRRVELRERRLLLGRVDCPVGLVEGLEIRPGHLVAPHGVVCRPVDAVERDPRRVLLRVPREGRADLEVAPQEPLVVDGRVDHDDVERESDLRQVGLENLRDRGQLRELRQGQTLRLAAGDPRLLEELLGALEVEGVLRRDRAVERWRVLAEREHGRLAHAEEHVVDHALAVDGEVNRVAGVLLVKGRSGAVDPDLVGQGAGGAADHGELAAEARGVLRRHRDDEVADAGLERGDHGVRVAEDLEDDAVDPRRALPPVGGIPLEDGAVAGHPLYELERTRADAAILERVHRGRLDDGHRL